MDNFKILRDGHIHSPYCPHGTKDEFQMYVDKALEVGLKEITFTEHMPLPDYFMDEELLKICAPNEEEIMLYLKEVTKVKEENKDKIKINIGLEVDYVEGYEEKIKSMLDKYGKYLDDAIISVHFIKLEDGYHCLDMSIDEFGKIADLLGGVEKVYDKYFETLLKSINVDLGKYKPRRIGHPTLVRIFNKEYPIDYKNKELIESVVSTIKKKDYEIDFNTAGLRKPHCKEVYPSGIFLDLVKDYGVRVVYGSDSHKASDVGKDFNLELISN